MSCKELDYDAELDVRILVADRGICPVRDCLKRYFGSSIKGECPQRTQLVKEFSKWEGDKFHKKYKQEFPDEA